MSGSEFGKGGDGLVPFVGGYERFEVVGLQGDRLETTEVRGLVVEEERSVRSQQLQPN
jgi:hypothetical protein